MTDYGHNGIDDRPISTYLSRRRVLAGLGSGALALGAFTGTAAAQTSRTLVIEGVDQAAQYGFTVSGALEAGTGPGQLNSKDEISGSTATGSVNSGADPYAFGGRVVEFALDGPARIILDGEEVSPEALPEPDPTPDEPTERALVVEGEGVPTSYKLTVSGSLRAGDGPGTLNSRDVISGSTATGSVNSGADPYAFTGELTSLTVDGTATVLVDGEVVYPIDTNGDDPDAADADHVLDIVGSGTLAEYALSVSGQIAERDDSLNSADSIGADGTSATGTVSSGTDNYSYTGDITAFALDGPATVFIDGDEVDPTELVGGGDPADVVTQTGNHPTAGSQGYVLFTFDDFPSKATTFDTAFPILRRRGMPATVGVITSRVDSSDLADLRQLKNAGWGIASHTVNHTRLTDVSDARARRELADSKAFLQDNDLRTGTWTLIYPKGGADQRIADLARQYYGFGLGGGGNRPPDWFDPLWIGRVPGQNQEEVITELNRASRRGDATIIMYHRLVSSGATGNEVTVSDFRDVVQKVANDGNLEAITPTQYKQLI